MKVLFIGHYRENSGWGHGAQDYILAMDKAGINVVPRCVKLGMNAPELPQRLLDLENQSSQGAEVCIQYVLPHLMDYNGGFKKNIGMYTTETDSFTYSGWVGKLNCMDELWVANHQMKRAANRSGVTTKTKIVNYPINTDKFDKEYEPLDIPPINGDFVFYSICDLTIRKNLVALVKAFHLEFSPSEPVSLLLKSGKFGKSSQENQQMIADDCNRIKSNLKLYKDIADYKPEIIITDTLSEEDLSRLHVTGDCFVCSSYGEAWCIPAMDALGYGNPVICTDIGGPSEFVNFDNGYPCGYHKEPVFGMTDTFGDIFTGREQWYSIDIDELRHSMRLAYEQYTNDVNWNAKREHARKTVQKYSYEAIGNQIKELLCQ